MAGLIAGHLMKSLSSATGMLGDLFKYNRNNFLQDREQRMAMEYKVMEMRVEQVELWRDDIRDLMDFSLEKLEVYLLVSTLELGFTVTAYVKSRVPAGGPPWLVSAHFITLSGAFMYFLLSLWLGIHAYVASVAYKVRILTHHVRLPVPTWTALEAARTYGSAFERMRPAQMFRVPVIMPQEKIARADATSPAPASAAQQPTRAAENLLRAASDPWGLERYGNDIRELAPDVNSNAAKQRHVWLAREAASFYQTHEAFSRVMLSLGTIYLAQFMCYLCLSYTLLSNAAPVPAFAGVFAFSAISMGMLWLEVSVSTRTMVFLSVLNFMGPGISSLVTFMSSKYSGYPGPWDYLMPLAILSHGVWLLSYLMSLRIRETESGAILPMAFRGILYIDVFGRYRSQVEPTAADATGDPADARTRQPHGRLPAMSCVDQSSPKRPEDLNSRAKATWPKPRFQPEAFATVHDGDKEIPAPLEKAPGKPHAASAARVFLVSTVVLVFMYAAAAVVAAYDAYAGLGNFGIYGQPSLQTSFITADLLHEISSGRAERIETSWPSALARPHSLACDAGGNVFAVAGQAASGRKALLHARLAAAAAPSGFATSIVEKRRLGEPIGARERHILRFDAAPPCPHAEGAGGLAIQDLAVQSCSSTRGCVAVVLPREGRRLVTCALSASNETAIAPQMTGDSTEIARSWLEDGSVLHAGHAAKSREASEELTSLGLVPCGADSDLEDHVATSEFAVVGTSTNRVVQLALAQGLAQQPVLAPRHVLAEGDPEVSGVGVFAQFGTRYLGMLHRKSSSLHILDLAQGGVRAGIVRLPPSPRGSFWSAVCAGGGSIYALEAGEDPAIWRFAAPRQLQHRP
mmetsp:Transcript_112440/g.195042  ORF Transcript_112440/g.195042 Transcript_112440/m.195042 type:complete len:860 (-) Transcript_112440:58-2637(-)